MVDKEAYFGKNLDILCKDIGFFLWLYITFPWVWNAKKEE